MALPLWVECTTGSSCAKPGSRWPGSRSARRLVIVSPSPHTEATLLPTPCWLFLPHVTIPLTPFPPSHHFPLYPRCHQLPHGPSSALPPHRDLCLHAGPSCTMRNSSRVPAPTEDPELVGATTVMPPSMGDTQVDYQAYIDAVRRARHNECLPSSSVSGLPVYVLGGSSIPGGSGSPGSTC